MTQSTPIATQTPGPEETRIDRAAFEQAMEAIWSEIAYINDLPRRTADEARDIPGFLTLARVYEQQTAEAWAMNPGPVEDALHGLRKLAAIYVRAMVSNGVRTRGA
jgi:hypothetical protein